MREDFTQKVINTSARRAGYHCSNPYCRKLTVGSNEDKNKSTLLGVAAHITAASPGGPRYNSSLNSEERTSIDNAIWLCVNCSTLIDRDPTKYSVEILQQWKLKIEKETSEDLQKNSKTTKQIISEEKLEKKPSFQQQAEAIKIRNQKQRELDNFLSSYEAIKEARNQLQILITRLKEAKLALEDPLNGLYFGHLSRENDMYGFGRDEIYVIINWSTPNEQEVKYAKIKAGVIKRSGHYGINYQEIPIKVRDYRYMRTIDGEDGWVDFDTGSNFISSESLIEYWLHFFIEKAKL